jgi:Tol biopolymer transport system component/predicted Ser/Thr protein kinase
MSPERWRRITDVFHAALAREAAMRGALLDEACAGDQALRAEVDALLAAHRDAGAFGEAPALDAPESPRLEPGDTLGPYRIHSLIGSGGMGEVYRARDTRLERDVAVKVLPRHVASDAALKQRLEREARALATLSHPHVCPVFDVGRQDGIDYLVMEYLDGETLARRLERASLPLDQALRCAIEIADALEKAHRSGIVHRDLKPGNIMLTKRGAKLLDFGLAKLRPASPVTGLASRGTGASSLTGHGTIAGTLHYMAPEQLNGAEADARTDIFAFGAVVYEMVTGRKAFEGKTPASLIAAILEHDPPPISARQPLSPPALDHLVGTCLAKDPDQRWQSASDVERQLDWLLREGSRPEAAFPAGAGTRGRGRRVAALAAAWLAALAIVAGVTRLGRAPEPPVVRSTLLAPRATLLDAEGCFALSPDGHRLAFVAHDADGVARLWVRSLGDARAGPLAGTEGARAPFWSPDGRDIGFFAGSLKRVPAAGGTVQVLAGPATEWARGGAWSPTGRIVYAPNHRIGLSEVPAGGGPARILTTLDAGRGERSHRWPQFLPDGKSLLFLVQTAEGGAAGDRSRIEVLDATGARHQILEVNASAAYAPPGRLLFWRDESLYGQEFDAKRLRLGGEARRLADDVGVTLGEWARFAVSGEGTLVYASDPPLRLEWRDRAGRLLSVAGSERRYANVSLSPDGRRVLYVADHITVWNLDLLRGTNTRVTFDDVDHWYPSWSAGGDWVAYAANKRSGEPGSEIVRRPASGLGEREVLYSSNNQVGYFSWSPDNRWIAFEESGNILLLDVASRVARPRVDTPATEAVPRFSPDGRWLAYVSDESGRNEVYVVPVFDGPGKWQVSSLGGFEPRWGATAAELYFLGADDQLYVTRVHLGRRPELGVPEPLFVLPGAKPGTGYDVAPDGRILVTTELPEAGSQSFSLVQNWTRLLEEPVR